MRLRSVVWGMALTLAVVGLTTCGDDDPTGPSDEAFSSRAYKGHANDTDMNHLVATYPAIAGTRLDDCQSCHTGGEVTAGTKTRFKNACDYCHFIPFPDAGVTGAPATYEQTLNAYGLAYKSSGRNAAAVRSIAELDSDGDGSTNEDEIDDSRYPGSSASKPGQPRASLKVLDMADLQAMPTHEQFLLANSHKQQFDTYALYRGVTVANLLTESGVNLEEITGITLIAADGYMKDFSAEAVRNQYPNGLFYSGLDTETKGPDCGFVEYPQTLPQGLTDGAEITDAQWLLLAFGRDGDDMDTSYLDPVSGRIEGEGPLRIIVPQSTPGTPDRGSSYSPSSCDDGYDYEDPKDHNAGDMVRGVVAIRVNPMPEGYEEFDAMNGGWAYVDAGQLVLYGHGID